MIIANSIQLAIIGAICEVGIIDGVSYDIIVYFANFINIYTTKRIG